MLHCVRNDSKGGLEAVGLLGENVRHCEERSARNLLEKYFSGLSLALLLLCVKRISQKIAASVKLCRYFATCFYRKLLELRTHVIDSLRI